MSDCPKCADLESQLAAERTFTWAHAELLRFRAENARLAAELAQAREDTETADAALADATEIILDMVRQHCHTDTPGELDSMALSDNADAMLWLADRGAIVLLGEPVGRRVIARLPASGESG